MISKEKPPQSSEITSKSKINKLTNSNLKSFDAEINQNISFGDDTVLFSVEPLVA